MSITLQHIDEFRTVLDDYTPSEKALEVLRRMPLVVLLGITGSGRNTIINHLVETDRYRFVISDTTRPPKFRDGKMEEDGVQYHFRTEEDLLGDLRDGRFLEAELIHGQQVSGMSIRELEKADASGMIPINEIDIGGVENVLQAKPDTKVFFIVPPNYGEWIYRLTHREEMSNEELRNRTQTAVRVIEAGLANDQFRFVINQYSHMSAQMIDDQVHGATDVAHDATTRQVAMGILDEIKAHL